MALLDMSHMSVFVSMESLVVGCPLLVTMGTTATFSSRMTQVPVTHRNFKLSSFSVMAASFPSLPASNNNKWYFTRQQIENSPSRRAGLDPDKELSYRQQAANLLQDMGQRLNVYLLSRDDLRLT